MPSAFDSKVNHMKKLLVFSATLLLTACATQSTSNLVPDTSAKAILDHTNNTIILPLDEYKYNEHDILNYQKAFDLVHATCFAKQGKTYQFQEYIPLGTRTYGLWNVEHAQQFGFGPYPTAQTSGNDPAVMETCGAEAQQLSELSPLIDSHKELLDRISREAFSAAQETDTWKNEREEWWSCLEEQGLTPRKGDNEWGTEQDLQTFDSTNHHESIRIATLEATCSHTTGMAQTLADLEASYQLPLIKANQSQLNQAKEELYNQRQKIENFINTYSNQP